MSPPADLYAPSSYAILKLYVHYQEGGGAGDALKKGMTGMQPMLMLRPEKKNKETICATSLNRFEEFQPPLAIYGLLLP